MEILTENDGVELLTEEEAMKVNGGGGSSTAKTVYTTVLTIVAGVLTGGNGYAMTAANAAASENFDRQREQYKDYEFDGDNYEHPYRDIDSSDF